MALKLIISRQPDGQETFFDFPASSLSEVYTSENNVVLFFAAQTITGNEDVNPEKFYYGTRITLEADGRGASLGLSIGRILASALNSQTVESRINLFELADSVIVEDIVGSAPTGGGGGTGGSNETLNTVTTRGATTGNVINVGGITTDFVQLDITSSPEAQQGMFSWNEDRSTANLQVDSSVSVKIGQDNYWYVKNQTGSTIPVRTAVMASGTLGASGRILVSPMIADGSVDAKFLLGITAEDIEDGEDGFVMNIGKLRQVNTSPFPAGTVLYCDPTVPGGLTGSEPQAPNLKLAIAFSIFQDNNNGTIAIRSNTGSDLYSDHRVQIDQAGLTGGQLLRYNNTLSRWENWTPNFPTDTPTLDQVTTAGNTTTNAITIGGVSIPKVFSGITNSAFSFSYTSSSGYNSGSIILSQYYNATRLSINNKTSGTSIDQIDRQFSITTQNVGTIVLTAQTHRYNTQLTGNYAWSNLSVELMRLESTGNLLIGTTTDSGYKLDVNGTTRLQNNVIITNPTSNTTKAIDIQSGAFFVQSNGYVQLAGIGISGGSTEIRPASINDLYLRSSPGRTLYLQNTNFTPVAVVTVNVISLIPTFSTSANAIMNGFLINPTINQTGGANGITRGLYVSPILTAAADFRAIETSAGKVIHQGLTAATQTNQVYYNTTTGELTYGALPTVATPTLDQVTTAGNTTTNSISIGASQYKYLNNIVGEIRGNTNTYNDFDLVYGASWNGSNWIDELGGYQSHKLTLGTDGIRFFNGSNQAGGSPVIYTERMRINASGNVLIGTTTDAGYKLDVNGSVRVKGTGTTSATTAFLVQNSTPANIFSVLDDGSAVFDLITSTSAVSIRRTATPTSRLIQFLSSGGARFFTFDGEAAPNANGDDGAWLFKGRHRRAANSGIASAFRIEPFFVQEQFDTIQLNSIHIVPTINVSGTATNVTVRGIYYNPTVASLVGVVAHRAIETTSGNIVFNGGNVLIGTTTDAGYKLDVNGTARVQGELTINVPSGGSNVRESLVRMSVADAPNDAFFIANGTSFDNTFWPAFAGFGTNANRAGLIFLGIVNETSDVIGDGSTSIINFDATRISGTSNPLNAARSAVTTKSIISIFNNGATQLRMFANGNLAINSTTDAGFKLDVNGTIRSNNVIYASQYRLTAYPTYQLLYNSGSTVILEAPTSTGSLNFNIGSSGTATINGSAGGFNGAVNLLALNRTYTSAAGFGTTHGIKLDITFNETGGAKSYVGYFANYIETSFLGTTGNLIQLQRDSIDRFIVNRNGQAFLPTLTAATQTNQVYYDSATGELTYGALPVVATPTLDQVTTAGNTTTNAITVGGLIVATNLIYTDTINGRVGIGTTGPSEKLDVNGNLNILKSGSGSQSNSYSLKLAYESDTATNESISILANPTGTTTSFVVSDTRNSNLFKVNPARIEWTNGIATITRSSSATPYEFGGDSPIRLYTGSTSWASITTNAKPLYFGTFNQSTAHMSIATTGNVLIGTTTDAGYKLDVNGTARVLGTTVSNLLVESTTDGASSTSTIGTKVGTVGAFFRSYGSSFSVASLAGTAGFGPNGASGLVIFTNAGSPINGSGYLSIRGGGYDSGAEMVYVDKNGTALKGNITAVSNIARGVNVTPVLTASANSDVLVGLDISTTFTNGAFTGVANYGLRIGGSTGLIYDQANNRLSTGGLPTNPISINTSTANPNGTIALFKTSLDDYTAFQVQNSIAAWQFSVRPTADTSNPGGFNFYYSGNNGASWNNIMTLRTNGNVGIGTTTDAGYKLDVNGTIRSKFTTGYNNTTTDGSIVLTSSNDGNVALGVTTDLALRIKLNTIGIVFTSTSGQLWISGTRIYAFNNTGVLINSNITNTTSTNDGSLIVNNTVNYVSASHIYTAQRINPTITGVTGCIARGLFISPTLTSVSDFRAIETSAGKIIHQGLTNASQANLIYYNSSTGELTYAAPQQTTAQTVADASKITASAATGSTQVASISASTYRSARFEYTITDSTNSRTGTVSAVWLGSSVQFSETTTQDIGDTSSLTFGVSVTGGTAGLVANATTGGWTVYVVGYGI